jgi:hypothetical protein
MISFALSTTSLSYLPGLLVLHCTNNFNHSGLDDRGPLIGGVIPKTMSRIDLILSFMNPLLLVSFAWYIAMASDNSGLNYPSQPTLSQAQSSFLSLQIYPLSDVAPTNVSVVPCALDC